MVDVSSITNAGNIPAQPNFLTTLQGYQALTNAQTQNQLTKAQIANTQQNTTNAVTTNTGALLDQTIKRYTTQAQRIMALAHQPLSDQTPDAYKQLVSDGLNDGTVTPSEAPAFYRDIEAAGGDPSKLQSAGIRHGMASLNATQQLAAGQGDTTYVDTAQGKQPMRGPSAVQSFANPSAPVTSGGGLIRTDLSQSQLAEPMTQQDTDRNSPTYGQNLTMTRGQWLQRQGATGLLPGGNQSPPVQPSGSTPQQPPATQGTQQPPPSAANPPRLRPAVQPTATGQTPQTPQTSQYGGATATSLPIGQPDVMEASAKQYVNDRADAGTYAQRMQPLEEVQDLLNKVRTGPGTETQNTINGWIQSHGDFAKRMGLDVNADYNANYDKLNKYMVQSVTSNPLAAGSDSRLAEALSGSPNSHISTLANQDVAKANIALTRMKQAAYLDYTGPPSEYADYLAKYSSKVDPRAFATDMMTPDQRKAMIDGMKPSERAGFFESVRTANRHPELSYNHMSQQSAAPQTAAPTSSTPPATIPPATKQPSRPANLLDLGA